MSYKKYLKGNRKCKIGNKERCLCCNLEFKDCPIKEEMEEEAGRFYKNV